MSFDLTNKNIQDTFQNLLQKTGSDGRLFDLEGNQVNDLTLTNLSASGHISASKFIGDGSELTGLSSAAISSYTNNGNNRVVTSVNSTTVNGEANLTFDGTNLKVVGTISASGDISSSGTIFANSGSFNYITASVIDVDSDTIRFGGETFRRSDVLKLKQGKSLKPIAAGRVNPDIVAHTGEFDGHVSSSRLLVSSNNGTHDFFLLKSGSLDSLKMNKQGVMVLGGFEFTPTAIRGGMYYDHDDDEFYLGKNN
tara:strand:- start:851 stop:1609 length:759 start_codon:yes stop_codon:yes gene_type:complete